ncbi:hypothetical protein N7447_001549 [Penicillium robsamsonii]|uniref:uncharacterized protein n=1 Tax=Penicillium robsamsonii TaxID=1792511 RepID=UPI002549B22F|nr:uncharacterized protein N7447_001549 [Penicillium robsamsonii]KAJ5835523.1 hypothetical protein N7447_001549 [Penicillium robsamsonii]
MALSLQTYPIQQQAPGVQEREHERQIKLKHLGVDAEDIPESRPNPPNILPEVDDNDQILPGSSAPDGIQERPVSESDLELPSDGSNHPAEDNESDAGSYTSQRQVFSFIQENGHRNNPVPAAHKVPPNWQIAKRLNRCGSIVRKDPGATTLQDHPYAEDSARCV